MRFCFPGIETPPGGRTGCQGQGVHSHPTHPAPPEGGGCLRGSAVSRGHAGALEAAAPLCPIAEGRDSHCSQRKESQGPALGQWGCAQTESLSERTHAPSGMHMHAHTCARASLRAQLTSWGTALPQEHPPSCFCCKFLLLPAGELPSR